MNKTNPYQLALTGLLIVLLVLFGAFYRGAYVLHVSILVMMNVVLGSSLRVINLSGQLSLGHGGFVTLGAYTSAVLLVKAGVSSTWLALLLSGVLAAAVCVLLGFPFSRLKGIYFTVVSIFVVQVIVLIVLQWPKVTGGASGLQSVPRPDSILGLHFHSKTSFYFLFLAMMMVSLLILWAVEHSRMGLTFRGIRQADSLAESVGINTMTYKVAAFAIGGFFAGLMGGLYVQYVSAVDPTVFGFLPTIYMLIYVIVGGEGSFIGPPIGAALLTVLPEVARPLKSWMPVVFAAILMLIIFLMPEGLVGLPRRIGSAFRERRGNDPMLQVEGLSKNFGGLAAVSDVAMSIQPGELVGLIGPNGAGKTTFFNLLTGYIRPSSGTVTFEDKNITGKKPHYVASRGIVRSFQQDNVFAGYTALENLLLAAHLNADVNSLQTVFKTRHARRRESEIRTKAEEVLELVGIQQLAGTTAGSLAHGHKRMLGIAIALMCRPKLLLLDEPLAGMNVAEVDETLALIRKLWDGGLTTLLIEHNMRAAMSVCQRFVVLSFGKKIAEGTPDEIRNNPEVVTAYLGTAADVA